MITHFIGFKDDRYWNAVRVFGRPNYFHAGWDLRSRGEIADGDLVVFAEGTERDERRTKSYSTPIET